MAYGLLASRAIIGRFYQRYERAMDASISKRIGWLNTDTNQETETYRWLGQAPMPREWVGGRQVKPLPVKGYDIRNLRYEATLGFSVDDLRRDKTGQINLRTGELAVRAGEHWDVLISALREANGVCYDGQNFYDTDHSEGDSGTQKNALANTEVPALNVNTAAEPTTNEMAAAILGVISYAYRFKDEQGQPMHGGAREWLVVCPPHLIAAAAAACSSDRLNSGESNPLQQQAWKVSAVCDPRLSTSANVFYVDRVDSETKPFILQSEKDVETQYLGAGSDHEFKDDEHLFGIRANRNVGYGLWQHSLKATLS